MTGATLTSRGVLPIRLRRSWRGALLGFTATLLLGLNLAIAASLVVGIANGGVMMPNVRVAGIDVSGLTPSAAAERLSGSLPSLAAGSVTVSIHGEEHTRAYGDLGRGYRLTAMVDAAYGVARGDNPFGDGLNRLRSLFHATSLPVLVHPYDAAALDAAVADIVAAVNRPPVDAVAVRNEDGAFAVSPSVEGVNLDPDVLRSALAATLATDDPASVTLPIGAELLPPTIPTAQAEAAVAAAELVVAGDLRLTIGDDEHVIGAAVIGEWLSFGTTADGSYGVVLAEAEATAAVEGLVEAVARDPVNASFTIGANGAPGGVVAAVEGRALNVPETVDVVLAALDRRAAGGGLAAVPLVVDVTQPALTTAAAEAALPRMEMVSTWTTYYAPGPSNHYGANINIPARDIDGTVLAPGQWFSFWNGIGPVTMARGYGMGGAIINGRTVLDGALAGGICSTSTTLFNAAARAGLEIGDRKAHSYYISRYPVGLDATVWMDEWVTQDMTFRNDTDQPILIRGFGGNGYVRFDLWTVPTGRTVTFSQPVITNRTSAVETRQTTSELPAGTTRRVQEPYNGFNATVSRTVTDASGNVIHSDSWFSPYRTVNGITLVGTGGGGGSASAPGEGSSEGGAGGVASEG